MQERQREKAVCGGGGCGHMNTMYPEENRSDGLYNMKVWKERFVSEIRSTQKSRNLVFSQIH